MKKVIYSTYTKVVASFLFIICVTASLLSAESGITEYFGENEKVYAFEESFTQSRYADELLGGVEGAVTRALCYAAGVDDIYDDEIDNFVIDVAKAERYIEDGLLNLWCSDSVDYAVLYNGKLFTNCNAESPEELNRREASSYVSRENDGTVNRSRSDMSAYFYVLNDISALGESGAVEIGTAIKDKSLTQYENIWNYQEKIIKNALIYTLLFFCLGVMMFIYLTVVCGRSADGALKKNTLDKMWAEIGILIGAAAVIAAICLVVVAVDEFTSSHLSADLVKTVSGTAAVAASAVFLTVYLSAVRNIKAGNYLKTSIIFKSVRWCLKLLTEAAKACFRGLGKCKDEIVSALSKKSGVFFILVFIIYSLILLMFGAFATEEVAFLFLALLVFLGAVFVIFYRVNDIEAIKKGADEVRRGDVVYKIPPLKCSDLNVLAENINDIAKGLDESVAERVKAQRLKTELITNVSHDLKTPITSVISYAELLEKEELSEKQAEYVDVIKKKALRLKKLTADLFDISKAQSGNEAVLSEKLDISLLINQAMGEYDNEIKKSEITFVSNLPKEAFIYADGRKMSRVMGNLLNNILKYSLKGTRAFVTVTEDEGEITAEFKNIASYPMDFKADEIVGRFVRGDAARTMEGNGLGLAIAKSYTELCGGTFRVVTDGDMFKALLTFEKA